MPDARLGVTQRRRGGLLTPGYSRRDGLSLLAP